MAEKHVTAALRRKYAELKGILKHRPKQDPEAMALALEQVGTVLLMFSPAEDLEAIKPKRPYKTDRRRWLRLALDMLRTAGRPLGGREIARAIIAAGYAEPSDLLSIECSLYPALEGLEGRGLVRTSERPRRWRLGTG